MKKLLTVLMIGGGLLLLAGCVPCDEMCSKDSNNHKAPSAGLHKKNLRDDRASQAKAAPKKMKKKVVKKAKPTKKAAPKKMKKKVVKKAKPAKKAAPKKMKKKKAAKKAKSAKKSKTYAYGEEFLEDELAEYAPWADEQKEIASSGLA